MVTAGDARRQARCDGCLVSASGPEFQGAFEGACRDLGLRHTWTKPRHAWTNGFVERLQGTIPQELWRVAFRRRYFTTRAALQRALDGFMRYYNTEPPIKAIVSAAARPPRWSGAWRLNEAIHHHSGTSNASTPFRVWTL